MEEIKKMFNASLDYLKANPILAYVLIGIAALLVIVIIVAICKKASRKKTASAPQPTAQEVALPQQTPQTEAIASEEPVVEEPIAEEPVVETPVAEEPIMEEPVADEPVQAPETEEAIVEEAIEEEPEVEESQMEEVVEMKDEKAAKNNLYDELVDAEEDIFYDENEIDKRARYSGKWLICRVLADDTDVDEMYFFELHASNGEKLLSSEEYTSYTGAIRGIETHRANILRGNFRITTTKKGDYIFKLLSGKNLLLCMGENYPTRARCEKAIESAQRFAKTAVIDENVQDHIVKIPKEDDSVLAPLADGHNGKWVVLNRMTEEGEVFWFELYANNGEKLLSSEDYTSYIGAVNGIQTHKNNIEKNNFRISLTKRGDYIYKLLNGNGQLLCLGEHYRTKRLCQNAVESVRRFSKYSPVLTAEENTLK